MSGSQVSLFALLSLLIIMKGSSSTSRLENIKRRLLVIRASSITTSGMSSEIHSIGTLYDHPMK